jgi:hypothetical protein
MNALAGLASRRRSARASLVEAVLAAGLAVAAALALGTGFAQAKATPRTGGVVHIYEASTSTGNTGTDILTGAISDYGTDTTSANGATDHFVLKKGSFEANLAALDAKIHPVSEDLADCSIVLAATAPITLSHGTGAYKGISGSIKVNFSTAIVFKVKKGAKCSPSITAPELSSVQSVTGSGRVSF